MPAGTDNRDSTITTWSEGNRFYFGYLGNVIFSYEVLENVPVFVFRRHARGRIVEMLFQAILSYTRKIRHGLVDYDDIWLQTKKTQKTLDRCKPLTLSLYDFANEAMGLMQVMIHKRECRCNDPDATTIHLL